MLRKLVHRLLREPEAAAALTSVAAAQAACPGVCVRCAAPVGGVFLGGLALRFVRLRRTRQDHPR